MKSNSMIPTVPGTTTGRTRTAAVTVLPVVVALLGLAVESRADEMGTITRRGYFEEITDSAAGLEEAHITLRRSEDSGLAWPYVISCVDPAANTITTVLSQASFSMWAISASPAATRRWAMYD